MSPQFSELVKRIEPSVDLVFEAARNWIARENIDAVCVFNGRMDVTRAIYEAAKRSNIPVVSHERSWFGNGIQLYPEEHCLSLRPVWEMVSKWIEKPLTQKQALTAASMGAKRFLKLNRTEWRAYNVSARSVDWPISGTGTKVLILPSSSNEIWGHKDWSCQWPDILSGFEAVLDRLPTKPLNTVLRCHPNWAENIGKQDGSSPERYYSDWARKLGIHCVGSRENLDTLNLIQQADIIIVSVSSAALEAGLLGKKIYSVCPSSYHTAGFTLNIHNQEGLYQTSNTLLKEEIIRKTLRFIYTLSCRIPQYVNYVKAESSFGYKYFKGADPSRFMKMITDRALSADDETYSSEGNQDEDLVIQLLMDVKWQEILNLSVSNSGGERESILRRPSYRWMDKVREFAPVGDQ
ncbi:MAG: hypothetical protein FJ116_01670 [Deltaproteobacteria bacterium]|nr:hypothetical protein [Deltaproteobacteria bacterium]